MMTHDQLYALLEERRAELGLSQAEVGRRATGRSDGSILQNIKRGSSPSFENLGSICSALGLTLTVAQPSSAYPLVREDEGSIELRRKEALRGGYLPIPWHPEAARSGSAPVAFSPAWLDKHALIPDSLFAVEPEHIHLLGEHRTGDLVVIDVDTKARGMTGVWCYREDGIVRVSRVAFEPDLIVLILDDKEHPIRLVQLPKATGFKLLGRVVWWSRILV